MADYSALIVEGVARALPFVCANPDLVVDVGAVQLPCAGSIAAEYERRGGEVFWAGKPHPAAYATALARAAELRGAQPDLTGILAIGDAVRTDLAAAQGLGVDALFIATGIHKGEVVADGAIDPARLAALFDPPGTPASHRRHDASCVVGRKGRAVRRNSAGACGEHVGVAGQQPASIGLFPRRW